MRGRDFGDTLGTHTHTHTHPSRRGHASPLVPRDPCHADSRRHRSDTCSYRVHAHGHLHVHTITKRAHKVSPKMCMLRLSPTSEQTSTDTRVRTHRVRHSPTQTCQHTKTLATHARACVNAHPDPDRQTRGMPRRSSQTQTRSLACRLPWEGGRWPLPPAATAVRTKGSRGGVRKGP